MINKILAELRRQMNGAISQTMRELGQRDFVNFGVSIPTIKEIALRYAPNHTLACELAARKSREARIAALYVAVPNELTAEQMEQWSSDWQNEEIARLSAMLLFHKSSDALKVAERWLDAEELRRIASLYIIGKCAAMVNAPIIERVLSVQDENHAMVYALREIYNAREEFRSEIAKRAEQIEELKWQIEEMQ